MFHNSALGRSHEVPHGNAIALPLPPPKPALVKPVNIGQLEAALRRVIESE